MAGNYASSDLVQEAPRAKSKPQALPRRTPEAGVSVGSGDSTQRPTWRQSETDVGELNPDYEAQKSFLNGKEVPYATCGSSRPDFYTTGSSIEVKNYNVTNNFGRNSLINTVSNQVNKRIADLPSGTKQTIIIDVRGQQITNDVLRQIKISILEKCNTDVLIQFMR